MYWALIGITAAFLTSSGFVPQILKGIRTKRLRDVSAGMM
ncbi:MAG: hypothetical protein KAU14_06550, partial [Thermoplasmata archaeon]|nr:hypothetical protein [Thermoplasmata archaeon]